MQAQHTCFQKFAPFYSVLRFEKFKNSNIIDQQIVNLWVSPEYSVKKITNNIKKINRILNQL